MKQVLVRASQIDKIGMRNSIIEACKTNNLTMKQARRDAFSIDQVDNETLLVNYKDKLLVKLVRNLDGDWVGGNDIKKE